MGRTRGADRLDSGTDAVEPASLVEGAPAGTAAGESDGMADTPAEVPEGIDGSVERLDAGDDAEVGYEDLRGSSVYEPSRGPVIRKIVLWLALVALVAAAVVFQDQWLPTASQGIEDLVALFS